MQYFPDLKQGDPINRRWFNDLIGFCNSLVLRGDGRTTRVNRTASGTTVSAIIPSGSAGGGASGGGAGAAHLPFTITGGTAANVVEISAGFASRNGAAVYVAAGTATVSQSGYLMLRAPWDDNDGGWQPFEYVVIPVAGGAVSITDADFPLGYVTVSGGTAFEAATSFHPAMAVFIKAGTCTQ